MARGIVRAIPKVGKSGPKSTTLLHQQKSEITVPKIAFNVMQPSADKFGHSNISTPV